MPDDASESVQSLLSRIAAPTPTPAGGSAVALTAATAAALLEMVCEIGGRAGAAGLRTVASTARRLQAELIDAVSEDATAYRALLDARSTHQGGRGEGGEDATRRVVLVPLGVAEKSAEILRLGAASMTAARPATVSDLATAMTLAGAALTGAILTVRVNLRELVDPRFVGEIEDRLRTAASAASLTRAALDEAALRSLHDGLMRYHGGSARQAGAGASE